MLESKFPDLKQSIFTTISLEANEHQAVNLGQGFPNFEAPQYLLEQAREHIKNGLNQYAPMMGLMELREKISQAHLQYYQNEFNPIDEITITSGATEAIFCAISTVIRDGDEAIIFDPAYDSYNPNIRLNGGVPVHINLDLENLSYDWNKVESLVTDKTKLIILNTPHNPAGIVLSQQDLESLWEIIKDKDIYILSDEVYQHIIFDGKKHLSPLNDERFRSRTFAISSFGKSFHVTGWKVGYCIAPKELTTEFRKIHQYTTFCTFGAIQMAITDMMAKEPNYFQQLANFYQEKRDYLHSLLERTQFRVLPCSGSYFQLVDYSEYSQKNDFDFAMELIQKHKLATIPVSGLADNLNNLKLIRLCFAKTNETIDSAFKDF